MVAGVLRRRRVQEGLRPFDPVRDLKAVVDLMEAAFGDELDAAGQQALTKMRRTARWGFLLGWPLGLEDYAEGTAPGFVWIEGGQVVGNVSVRRARPDRSGWLVGNVAVHPHWRGRGIARELMTAAIDLAQSHGGTWIGLEVRTDNTVAMGLYRRLGFRQLTTVVHLTRPTGLPWPSSPPLDIPVRRAAGQDGPALFELAQASYPAEVRPLLGLRREDYTLNWARALDNWLASQREVWWVAEAGTAVAAAVRAATDRRHKTHRLELLLPPDEAERLAEALVGQGMAALSRYPPWEVSTQLLEQAAGLRALEVVGFQRTRALTQMRLKLGHRLEVHAR